MSHARVVTLTDGQRAQLKKWATGGSTPYRLVVRSHIVLLAAAGYSNREIVRTLHVNPITVSRWRSRFLLLGLEGIRTDAPRSGAPVPNSRSVVQAILSKTINERPAGGGHWSTRSMARAIGVSHSTVRRVWKRHGIQPRMSRLASLVNGSMAHPRSIDIVGVYVNPPRKAIAVSVGDRPSPEGAPGTPATSGPSRPLSRTPPGLSRFRVADLVTALNLIEGTPLRGSSRRLIDPEFLAFLHSVAGRRAGRGQVRLLAGSEGEIPPSALSKWLHHHPDFSLRILEGGSLPEIATQGVAELTLGRRTEPILPSLPSLRTAIDRWLREKTTSQRPFAWTKE